MSRPAASRPRTRRLLAVAALLAAATLPAGAVQRDAYKEIRDRLVGTTLRLRIDLKSAGHAVTPNAVSVDGVHYGSERAPVLFERLQKIYVDRVTDEGGQRLGLTIYRDVDEARSLRASDIPQPGNPMAGRTLALFAQTGSTSVTLELRSGKKDQAGQLAELELLLGRIFYVDAEPTQDELEEFVRRHRGSSIGWLHSMTGLDPAAIRALLAEHPAP